MTLLSVYLVTTVSPSAICSSMVKLMIEKASRISATDRLKSSRVGPCPGSRPRSTKSGLSSSSITSRFPLACSSKKRRTSALLSSNDTEPRPSCPEPAFGCQVPRNQTIVQPKMRLGTLSPGSGSPSAPRALRLLIISACQLFVVTVMLAGVAQPESPTAALLTACMPDRSGFIGNSSGPVSMDVVLKIVPQGTLVGNGGVAANA